MKTYQELYRRVEAIKGRDPYWMTLAQARWDQCAKPKGSLGLLEELTVRMAGMLRQEIPDISQRAHLVMAGDNGICEENIGNGSLFPEMTSQLVQLMASGGSGAAVMCQANDIELTVYDLGTYQAMPHPAIVHRRHRPKTSNFMHEPAMTEAEVIDCIQIGIEAVETAYQAGARIIGTGEIGLGNTTTSAAVVSALLDLPSQKTVGPGAGVSPEQLANKYHVVDGAVDRYQLVGADPLVVLQTVGGYDLAGLVGVYLGAGLCQVPVIIDGLISAAAALVASQVQPLVTDYMLASHRSSEVQVDYIFQALGLRPLFDLDMRLGEGTGCPLAIGLLDTALYTMRHMASFTQAAIAGDDLLQVDNSSN